MAEASKKIFGTDGVRGRANVEPVTAERALKLGRAAAHVFKQLEPRSHTKHKIVIGKDTRLSGYMLENAISSGILSVGVDVLFIGPLPTPGVAYVTRSLRADAGIVITASHNPYDDNGIKFFRPDGFKLDDEIEKQVERLVFSGEIESIRPSAKEIGKAVRIDDALGRYIEYAKSSVPRGVALDGIRIVVDCAHGSAYKATPCVLRELGAEVFVYGNDPDGMNINKECGSMYPESISQKVWKHRAHLGVSHDGDADRVLLVDETGRVVDGDDVLAIAGLDMIAKGTLKEKTVVATVMSNAGLDQAIRRAGGMVKRTPVGDKHVIDLMLRERLNLGGESSGHLIFRDHGTTGDGLVAALQILAIMKGQGKSLSELVKCWSRFPQLVRNVQVRTKVPFEELDGVMDLVSSAEQELQPNGGRVLLRYSGTELKARLLLEGPDMSEIERWSVRIVTLIRDQVGVD
ncbi:MAG: Phosphoglucosamine mutase [Verrucomicrobia subdivision 3 bacterium]|nr:Phosphoglucosamine mutase [Limisphaerales bacterium]MCS1412798.1 Phosphoglucosamine mutase [Limisphaerales bacterium]